MSYFRLIVLALAATCFIACGDDDDGGGSGLCGSNWSSSEEFQDELDELTNAAAIYSNDPTTANCEAYKDAYLDYLDEVRDFEECYVLVGQQTSFNQAVDQAEAAINNLNCQ